MKLKRVSQPGKSSRLILIFAGWAMDARPFEGLAFADYDIAIVYDLREPLTAEQITEISEYKEIVVVAWSFGVVGAEMFLAANPELPVTATIAVNGTPEAVDDRLGIPTTLFEATLKALTPASLRKFYRRVGGRRHQELLTRLPEREFEELADELEAVRRAKGRRGVRWDKAIIGEDDLIIPPANQQAAWATTPTEIITVGGMDHLPDFATILRRHLSDKSLVASKFSAAVSTYDDAATVQRSIAAKIASKIPEKIEGEVIEIGCGTGIATKMLLDRHPDARLRAVDIQPSPDIRGRAVVCADGETWLRTIPGSSVGMVYSVSAIQWFNSQPRFFREALRILRPGGVLLVTTFGSLTMRELREEGINTRHYPTPRAIASMLDEGWEDVSIETELITPRFSGPRQVLDHLRSTGVNALPSRNPVADARALLQSYPLDSEGLAPLTYQPVYITARKKWLR